jgi:RNA polymerase sigma-70 factor (ECF subfamily)
VEKLSPTERAAYVLREAFDYPYRDIAGILRLEEANTRQLVTRARQHVAEGRRAPVSSIEQRRLLNAFIGAAERGDVAELEGLSASDIVSTSDGGGFVRAARTQSSVPSACRGLSRQSRHPSGAARHLRGCRQTVRRAL